MIKTCLRPFLVLALAACAAAVSGAHDSPQTNQQKARAALDKMIQALGGQAYLTLQDSIAEGRSGRFNHGTSEGGSVYRRFWQWPDRERLEWTKQRDVVQITAGDKMYEITFRGTRPIDPSKDDFAAIYLGRRHHALEIVLRDWLSDPGIALFDEGPSLAENHSVERITIMNPQNDAVTMLIDTETHLPVKTSFVMRDAHGFRDEIAEIYDNWKMVQGINTPYNTLITRNGELERQYFLTSITYNTHPAASLFDPSQPLKTESNTK